MGVPIVLGGGPGERAEILVCIAHIVSDYFVCKSNIISFGLGCEKYFTGPVHNNGFGGLGAAC